MISSRTRNNRHETQFEVPKTKLQRVRKELSDMELHTQKRDNKRTLIRVIYKNFMDLSRIREINKLLNA